MIRRRDMIRLLSTRREEKHGNAQNFLSVYLLSTSLRLKNLSNLCNTIPLVLTAPLSLATRQLRGLSSQISRASTFSRRLRNHARCACSVVSKQYDGWCEFAFQREIVLTQYESPLNHANPPSSEPLPSGVILQSMGSFRASSLNTVHAKCRRSYEIKMTYRHIAGGNCVIRETSK